MVNTVRIAGASFLLAVASLVVFLALGGGAPSAAPPGIPDPGLFVGWGLPVLKVVTDISAVVTIGFLVLAVFLLPSSGSDAQGLAVDATRIASRAAAVWCVATLVLYLFTVGDVFAQSLDNLSPAFIISLTSGSVIGRGLLVQALGAAVVAIVTRWTLGIRRLAVVLGFAVAMLAPVSLTGHAASSGSHDLATTSLLLHLVGISLWVGGLAAVGWVALRGSKRLRPAIARFSTLAAWCLALVAGSGLVNALVRLGSPDELFASSYGWLVIGKIVAVIALGTFGWFHRRRIVEGRGGFGSLALGELLVMAVTMGLSVALSRTPTPLGENVLQTRIEQLLGGPIPPAPTVLDVLFGWSGNGFGIVVVVLGTALYARGVLTLRRRGDRWPVGRTLSWALGMLVIAWSTFGGLGEYAHVLFSAHMVSHMLLTMVAPIFLVLAAPVTLALRTLPGPRQSGEVSPRGLLTAFLHSRFMRFMTHPLVGPVLFVGSLYALYFTSLFSTLMSSHLGHTAMEVHFLATGALFYYVLVGVDPSPRTLPPLVRFGALMFTIPFHAFFSIAVMSSNTVFAQDYWLALDRPYRTDLLVDQYLGGGIAWAMGEVPLLLVMGALFVQWIRSDQREARRYDRAENRNADHDLETYNAYLASLAEHGRRREP